MGAKQANTRFVLSMHLVSAMGGAVVCGYLELPVDAWLTFVALLALHLLTVLMMPRVLGMLVAFVVVFTPWAGIGSFGDCGYLAECFSGHGYRGLVGWVSTGLIVFFGLVVVSAPLLIPVLAASRFIRDKFVANREQPG